MATSKLLTIAFEVIGGLGIFLLGMKNMSEGMQAVAGERLRKLINAVTDNRFMACAVGVLVTCLVQSSSVTTVMVVGMVNASLMTLTQAVGVILGANIGTTITGWILVLKIGKYGLPIIGAATFFYLFSKNDKIRHVAMLFLGVGMVFFGLALMKNGFKPIRGMPEFVEWFHRFEPNTFWGLFKTVLVGATLTAIVQSSSATLGITIGLATTGVISYDAAVALVLGENIGTTITARLASIGASDNAKRASYAHVMANVLAVIIMMMIFPWYVDFIKGLTGIDPMKTVMVDGSPSFVDVTLGIATSHTVFNVILALVYLPLLKPLVKILYLIVPDKGTPDQAHLTYLDVRLVEAPSLAVEQSQRELGRMADHCVTMLGGLRACWTSEKENEAAQNEVFEKERELDLMQKEVMEFLGHLLQASVGQEVVDETRGHLRLATELESIGDYIERVLKLKLKLVQSELSLSQPAMEEIMDIHDHVTRYMHSVAKTLKERNHDLGAKAHVEGDNITHLIKEYRSRHLQRMEKKATPQPFKSLVYQDVLNGYRRIKDHILNVAEVVAGEK